MAFFLIVPLVALPLLLLLLRKPPPGPPKSPAGPQNEKQRLATFPASRQTERRKETERQRDKETERQRPYVVCLSETEREKETDKGRDGGTERQGQRDRDRETETTTLRTNYENRFFSFVSCAFSVLVAGFGQFRARIRILHVKKLPGDTSLGLEA